MDRVRVAVVGAGHLGRFHARLAAAAPEIELVAVVDPVESGRVALAEETETKALADYRQVIDDVDAAIVATPTTTHHAIGCDLLEAGLHLLVEKPLAATAAEATALVATAEQHECILQVGHVERFNPGLRAVEHELSDPKFIEATRLSGYPFRSTDIGVVLDLMIHDLEIVLSLARSPVVGVEALGMAVFGRYEDMASARLTFASGCVAQLTASRVSYEMRRAMHVFTSRAHAAIDFAAGTASLVKPRGDVLRRTFEFGSLSADDVDHWKQHLYDDVLARTNFAPEKVNAIAEEQREFVASVRGKSRVRVDGAAGRDAVAVAETILAKIADHNWDGDATGRRGPLAMPALPILPGPPHWHEEPSKQRRAG